MAITGETKETRPREAVRISIPASVAYDIGSFQKSIAAIAEQFGCPKCVSGRNCAFLIERGFLVNEKIGVSKAADESLAKGLTVTLPGKVMNNLDSVFGIIPQIAETIACPKCCSGYDITFQQELYSVPVFNASVNLQGNVGAFSER